MIENTLHIGSFQYLTQLYTEEDFGISESISANFVMIRNFNIVNDIINDTHIYIMSKESWLKLCEEIENNKENDQYIYQNGFDKVLSVVFPIQTTEFTGYSSLYSDFNSNLIRESLYKYDNGKYYYGNSVYPILDENGEEKLIKCYKLRIYHPSTKSSLQSIITIENHINGIHWYYLCNTLDKFPYKSETEIRKNNNIYSEYIEILFPNIDFLFGKKFDSSNKEIYNTYFDERINTIISTKNENYINNILIDEVERYYNLTFDIETGPSYKNTYNPNGYYVYIGKTNIVELINQDNFDYNNYCHKFNYSSELFNYLRSDFFINNDDIDNIYILIPNEFANNIIVHNVLNLKNDYSGNYDNSLPIFEILCDECLINNNLYQINGNDYKIFKTKSKCQKIKLHNTYNNQNLLIDKYMYIGSENPFIENTYQLKNDSLNQLNIFKDIKDIFNNSIDTTRFTYHYNEYEFENNNPKYILIPSIYVDQLILSNSEDYIDSSNIIYEISYEIIYDNIIIDNINDTQTKYSLLCINNIISTKFRIYYICTNNTPIIYNIENVNIVDDNKYGISNYINLQNQLVPLSLLLQPFIITEDIDPLLNDVHNVKLYLKHNKTIENNYIMTPFNVSIYPYEYIDSNTGQYIYDDSLTIGNIIYNIECIFRLNASFGFNEETHKPSIVTHFNYPNKEYFLSKNQNDIKLALQNAYTYYNNIEDIDIYKYFWVDLLLNIDNDYEQKMVNWFDILCDSKNILYDVKGKPYVNVNDKKCYNLIRYYINEDNEEVLETINDISDKEKIKRLIDINYDNIWSVLKDWEIEEEYQTNMDFFGFRIQIATDMQFKNIIYNQTYSIDITELDDFCFDLNNIFESWLQFPDTLICSISFIDHIVNKVITSNNIIITKEYFKYLVNENNLYSLDKINEYNKMLKEINLDNITDIKNNNLSSILDEYVINMKYQINQILAKNLSNAEINEQLDLFNNQFKEYYANIYSPFNFINNINCVINKDSTVQTFVNQQNNYIPKIIYQPIYFRTQELQNIKIRDNITQNIGINLSKYMAKVESFKLIIDNLTFIENGRNDSYIIFNINGSSIENNSGTYNIVNQDDQYISSGNWEKY